MRKQIDLPKHCKALIKQHGSTRAAGESLGIDFAYLHRMASGEQRNPSDDVLAKLGLVRTVAVKFYLADGQ